MFFKKSRICLFVCIFALSMAFNANSAENKSLLAVASDSPQPQTVSEMAGRAAYFLLFDGSGNFLSAERNPFASATREAGPKVAAFLSAKGVTLVLAGEFGTKMERALISYNMKYIKQAGVAHEVVQTVIQKR
jgi:predicted Fe-Mo cluster-binding NifX family protein